MPGPARSLLAEGFLAGVGDVEETVRIRVEAVDCLDRHGELEHLARAGEEEQRLGLTERQSVAHDGGQLGDGEFLGHQVLHFVYTGQCLLLHTNNITTQ